MSTPSQDTLPASVPKLETSGKNWLLFSIRFQLAVKAKGKWGHFDGSVPRPGGPGAAGAVGPGENESVAGTDAADDEAEAAVAAVAAAGAEEVLEEQTQWDKDEDIALYLLSQRLQDSTLVSVERFRTCAAKWKAIVQAFTEKSVYAQTALRAE